MGATGRLWQGLRMTAEMALDELDSDGGEVARPTIDRAKVARYFFRSTLVAHALITLTTVGIWLPFFLLWVLGLGRWYAARRAHELDYRLLPGRILVRDGVFTKVRRTIPLDRITDISLNQGIVDRWFGLWRLGIQTASSGQPTAEGVVYGLIDPKGFRAEILGQRDRWLSGEDALALPAARERAALMAPASALAPTAAALERAPSRGAEVASGSAEARLDRIESLLAEIAVNTRRG